MNLRIGTRGSDLALWQARYVAARLVDAAEIELVVLRTRGDVIDDVPLTGVEGKAFFTAEIERALLEQRVDIAVHSHKDLPTEMTPGLVIAAVPERASQRERLLALPEAIDPEAPFLPLVRGALIGTSSPRREEQLRTLRPDLRVASLRGNVPTRVRKLRELQYDAIVLASAGLDRLALDLTGLEDRELPLEWFVPAPAQGALAIQIREGNSALAAFLRERLHDQRAARAVRAERGLLERAGGGCNLPLGAAVVEGDSGPFRAFLFLGAGHPEPNRGSRWAWGDGATPEAAANDAAKKLFARAPTLCGPLAALRVALTGSSDAGASTDGSDLGERLRVLGASVAHEAVIEFEDLPCRELSRRIAALSPGDGVAVTSRQAARRLSGISIAAGVCLGAVGRPTARALEQAGLRADVVGSGGARELARVLPVVTGARVLFPCAAEALPDLELELSARGVRVERMPLYRTRPVAGARLEREVDARVFMSPSSVHACRDFGAVPGSSTLALFALGESTRSALLESGLPGADAFRPSTSGGEELVAALWSRFARREVHR